MLVSNKISSTSLVNRAADFPFSLVASLLMIGGLFSSVAALAETRFVETEAQCECEYVKASADWNQTINDQLANQLESQLAASRQAWFNEKLASNQEFLDDIEAQLFLQKQAEEDVESTHFYPYQAKTLQL